MIDKKFVFEYIVYSLDKKREELSKSDDCIFTKLRLQKLLFLISTINATCDNHCLLDCFNDFFVANYGPIEKDINYAMNNDGFKKMHFDGNKCVLSSINDDYFMSLDELRKKPHKSSVCGMNCVFFRILFVYF